MQPIPRILANLPVILVKIPVNLLVKLAKLRVRGAMGLRVRGIHSGEARTLGVAELLGLGPTPTAFEMKALGLGPTPEMRLL